MVAIRPILKWIIDLRTTTFGTTRVEELPNAVNVLTVSGKNLWDQIKVRI
jgi:hypothetical protein